MENFSNLQSLWNYCLNCPICNQLSRHIEVIIGPEDTFKLTHHHKHSNVLTITVKSRDHDSTVHKYEFTIDCISNSFTVNKKYEYSPDINNFYLYLFSNCDNCDSHVNTSDIDFNFTNKQLEQITLDQEGVNLLNSAEKYYIQFDYTKEVMLVSKLLDCNNNILTVDDKYCSLPVIKFDYSDQDKVVSKIKSLLIFS